MPVPRDRDVEAILAYLEGRASPEEAAELERRVKAEPELAERLAVQARLSVMLDALSQERVRVAAPSTRRRPLRTGLPGWAWGLAAAAALVAVGMLAALLAPGPTPPVPRGAAARRSEPVPPPAVEAPRSPEPGPPPPKPELPAPADPEERKRRIEAEMKAAIEKGRPPGPAPTTPVPPKPATGDVAPPPKPEAPTRVAVGRAGRVEGEAFVTEPGGRKPLAAGQDLLAGQGLETAAGGRVEVVYPDQTRVEFAGASVVRELRDEEGKRIVVERGSLRAQVKPQPKGRPLVIETLHGEATVLGTTLKVLVDPDPRRGTTLEVEEGRVRLTSRLSGRSVEVAAGHVAIAAAGVELAVAPLPAVLYAATFDDGRAPGWTFSARFPWTLKAAPSGGLALSSPAVFNDPKAVRADYIAVLANRVWQDGVVEVDVRPEELDPVGLTSFLVFARYRDPDNAVWFEVLLDKGNWTAALLQHAGGTLSRIAGGPAAPLQVGRTAHVRLELKGEEVRAAVDGKELASGRTAVVAPGRLALCPMASRIAFDNIRVTAARADK
jgi:ferric-dicitrate binding protein FerR (iron transport regulator)